MVKIHEIKLRDHGSDTKKRWCVFWYQPGEDGAKTRHIIWISEKFKTAKERYLEADRIIKEVQERLHENKPFQPEKIQLITALERVLIVFKSYLSFRSYQAYRAEALKLQRWLRRRNITHILASEFTKYHANQFVNDVYHRAGVKTKTINCYVSLQKSMFGKIAEITEMKDNPFRMKKLPEQEPDIQIWDERSKKAMAEYLREEKPEMLTVILFIYHCFLRPNEVRQIQVMDIDLKKKILFVSSKKGKSNRNKYPTLSPQLLNILKSYAGKLPGHFYLFSRGLRPGVRPISRNVLSNYFRLFRKACGLPKKLKLYNFKHTGNTELIDQGLDIYDLMRQNGHSDIKITEKYIKRLKRQANVNILNLSKPL